MLWASMPIERLAAAGVLAIVMIVMAWIDLTQLKVPNRLTFPTILTGWLYALIKGAYLGSDVTLYLPVINLDLFQLTGTAGGMIEGLWTSLGLTFYWPTLVLLVMYSVGGMGAGDVKMHMGFAAWIAAIYGWDLGVVIVVAGFLFGAIVGGVISIGMMVWRGDFSQNRKNAASIISDWFNSKSVGDVAAKAAVRKPTLQLLPYGVPLCIGYLSYLTLDFLGLSRPLLVWLGLAA